MGWGASISVLAIHPEPEIRYHRPNPKPKRGFADKAPNDPRAPGLIFHKRHWRRLPTNAYNCHHVVPKGSSPAVLHLHVCMLMCMTVPTKATRAWARNFWEKNRRLLLGRGLWEMCEEERLPGDRLMTRSPAPCGLRPKVGQHRHRDATCRKHKRTVGHLRLALHLCPDFGALWLETKAPNFVRKAVGRCAATKKERSPRASAPVMSGAC